MKKVSIVLPTYNGERYLEEAIQSVLKQTYQNLELIIVDDCSTDGTAEIIRRYGEKDPRIQVIHNEENQKLPRSLNIGFRRASGDYFTWTSDDNYYDEDAIETMVSFLEKNPRCGFIYCDMNNLYEDGRLLRSTRVRPVQYQYSESSFGACFLYRRRAAEAVGEYDPDMFLAEDYDYLLRIDKQFEISYLPVCKYTYRIHQESLSQTRTRQVWRQIWRLRYRELGYLLGKMDQDEQQFLFLDMWLCYKNETWELRNKFFQNGELPKRIEWIEKRMGADPVLDDKKQIILFGAGEHGIRALNVFGKQVAYFIDNNPNLVGSSVGDIPVISFDQMKEICNSYQLVLSVGSRFLPEIVSQLENSGITKYELFLEMWMKN